MSQRFSSKASIPKKIFGKKKLTLYQKKVSKGNVEKEEIEKLHKRIKKLSELDPVELLNFNLFPLSFKTQKGLENNGFVEPTKVQRLTMVHSLQGLDVVAAAKTGSGKTLAFIIPLLELLYSKMWSQVDGLGALIITPTRELAYQIFEVINKVGKCHNFSVGLVIGGKDLKFEWSRIYLCNILICTPGRLLQHMTENPEFMCNNVQVLVLDEADQCLSMGFADTMNLILEELPSCRQTLLFSATQTRDVQNLIRAGCKDPVFCSVHEHSKTVTPTTLKESYLVCEDSDKLTFLWSFIKHHKKHKILVFLSTCKQVKFLHHLYTSLRCGVTVMGLHGEMHQLRRMAVYDEFCNKKCALLFATDVAARGLDIPSVDWVIQMDCPEDVITYIHRAGRTARHTKGGEALLLLTPSQEEAMINSLKANNIPIEMISVDTNKLHSVQAQAETLLSKHVSLKEEAERALKTYLKNIAHMKNKKIFNVKHVNLDKLARAYGLTVTPRVRFIERHLKKQIKDEKMATDSNSQDLETFSLGIDEDGESDDEFLIESKAEPLLSESPSDMLNDLTLFTKKDKPYISKYELARKAMKNNVKVNKRTVFDDGEEDEKSSTLLDDQVDESVSEQSGTGINISSIRELLKVKDKDDKKLNALRVKEKHRREKEKLKEERRLAEDIKMEEEGKAEMEDEESEEDSFTQAIIADLPDPDQIYDKEDSQKKTETRGSSDESSHSEDSDFSTKVKERKSKIKDFKGKRKAKEEAKKTKRARLVAQNDLEAISFNEKEDLALFLLRGGR